MESYDRLVELEESLMEILISGTVDGHDVGKGIFNLFVYTEDPTRTFNEVRGHLNNLTRLLVAAAFRRSGEDNYVRLWPEHPTAPFELR